MIVRSPEAPGGAVSPPPPPAAQTGAGDWTTGLDGDAKAFVTTKGWKQPGEAVRSYVELEKTLGADKIALPGKDAKPEDWLPVYDKLGRPTKADAYELKAPEAGSPVAGVYSPELATGFKEAAYAAGLNGRQAAALHDWYVTTVGKGLEGQATATAQGYQTGEATLRGKWGATFDNNMARANAVLGHKPELLSELKGLKLQNAPHLAIVLAEYGELTLGEDKLIGGAGGGRMTLTPDQAKAEIATLEANPLFTDRSKGTPAERVALLEKRSTLYKMAYPDRKA